jgi:hypothetical protein
MIHHVGSISGVGSRFRSGICGILVSGCARLVNLVSRVYWGESRICGLVSLWGWCNLYRGSGKVIDGMV